MPEPHTTEWAVQQMKAGDVRVKHSGAAFDRWRWSGKRFHFTSPNGSSLTGYSTSEFLSRYAAVTTWEVVLTDLQRGRAEGKLEGLREGRAQMRDFIAVELDQRESALWEKIGQLNEYKKATANQHSNIELIDSLRKWIGRAVS